MTDFEQQISRWSQIISTILTGTLTAGICWLMIEVGSSRERWARLEERLNSQSSMILDMREDFAEWKERRKEADTRMLDLERRLTLLEAQEKRR